jgi:hypothetical protein
MHRTSFRDVTGRDGGVFPASPDNVWSSSACSVVLLQPESTELDPQGCAEAVAQRLCEHTVTNTSWLLGHQISFNFLFWK